MGTYDVTDDDTAHVLWKNAARIIRDYHKSLFDAGINVPKETQSADSLPRVERVAVIGAGVSGLQVAKKLGAKYKVDVFEAGERVGGRLFTYDFKSGNEWDYFDVGAMRFPNTAVMKPTYDLFDELDLQLLPYEMEDKKTFLYYNNNRFQRENVVGPDAFGASVTRGGNVPEKWADIGYEKLMYIACGRWVDALRADYETYFPILLTFDEHSTRSYMAFVEMPAIYRPDGKELYPEKERYPTTVINWLETMTFSAGWFDRAFVETILELYAFAYGLKHTEWRCVEYGSQRIADAMAKKLATEDIFKKNVTIHLRHQVTSISYERKSGELTISGRHRPYSGSPGSETFTSKEKYSQVVLAVSPQVMRYIDLSSCRLDYTQRSALLMLSPGPSVKVGIKFKTNWWREKFRIKGGQSQTDLPVRTVVYPSYGGGKSTALIASYCWTQDASSMGALMQGGASFDDDLLKANILRDLASIHNIELSFLEEQFEHMYAFDWAHNPTTMGAYAFFGPGQFSSLFASMTRPAADLRLHFAGEAISTCHAWVAGAIESANRVVGQIDPDEYLSDQPSTIDNIPHGKSEKDYPVLLGKELLLLQMSVSNYLQGEEFKN